MSAPKLNTVSKQTAAAQATASLRGFIMSGKVRPGARLKEVQLADALGVARATLRSSLLQLVNEGIVVQIPYCGWQVMDLDAADIWELWTLRGSLESLASKLAAQSMTEETETKIRDACQVLTDACEAGNLIAASDADFALHRAIIDSVSHGRLSEQYRQVEQQVRFYIASSNELAEGDLSSIARQHDRLLEALFARDPRRAADEAWRHNESEGDKLLSAMERATSKAGGRANASQGATKSFSAPSPSLIETA
jgi:DNA-binding GntR family transcriptional regulator